MSSTMGTAAQRRRVLVLNGPNLGRLGTREPQVYGDTTYAELAALCVQGGAELGLDVEVRQTDHEGELLGWLHEAADSQTPVVLNAAALTHTSA
ncbi:MAG: 3-dehydroquinate dehydratase, partial [Pseudonocardiales bacterium]|nr:3-dehydroquinate dehydratase [Pseudonocardiales bacterium]